MNFLAVRPKATAGSSARFNINLPAESVLRNSLQGVLPIALSGDASRIAYVGRRPDGRNQIFVRRMDRITPEPVAGTEDAILPFFSPDGEWLGSRPKASSRRSPLPEGRRS